MPGTYEESEEHSKTAKSLFKECGDTYGEMVTSFWLMTVYDKLDKTNSFFKEAKHFSTLCIQHNYLFFLTTDTLFSPFDMQVIYPLFIRAGSENKDHDEIQQIVKQLNLQGRNCSSRIYNHRSINGTIKIILGLDEVEERQLATG